MGGFVQVTIDQTFCYRQDTLLALDKPDLW